MAEYSIQDTTLTGIADAIREKTGGTDAIMVSEMAAAIGGIEAGGGSGGGVNIKVFYKYTSITGTYGSRVSVNFGGKPLLLVIYPSDNVTFSTKNFVFCGSSTELKNLTGSSIFEDYVYASSGKTYHDSNGDAIDGTNTNAAVYGADETGFNLGKNFATGYYYVVAVVKAE